MSEIDNLREKFNALAAEYQTLFSEHADLTKEAMALRERRIAQNQKLSKVSIALNQARADLLDADNSADISAGAVPLHLIPAAEDASGIATQA